jgi:hypothetical protein
MSRSISMFFCSSFFVFLSMLFLAVNSFAADAFPLDATRSQVTAQEQVISFTSLTTKLNSTAGGDQINPSIASLPGDEFVAIWSDRAGNDGELGGIFGRIYTSAFEPVSPEFLVNTLTTGWQSLSNVASAVNGNFMAIWTEANGHVEGQVFGADGTKLGPGTQM